MNSMKLVIPLHSLYWSIHTKDESKHGTAFAFIFGVNWLWRCGVTASFGVFFHEIKRKGMTSFTEFRLSFILPWCYSAFQGWKETEKARDFNGMLHGIGFFSHTILKDVTCSMFTYHMYEVQSHGLGHSDCFKMQHIRFANTL